MYPCYENIVAEQMIEDKMAKERVDAEDVFQRCVHAVEGLG